MITKIIAFPFRLLMMIAGFIFSICGKMVTILLGIGMMVLGIVLCATLVGMVAGIPLVLIGFTTTLKGLF